MTRRACETSKIEELERLRARGLSIVEAAAQAKVSKSTAYEHFSGKRKLVDPNAPRPRPQPLRKLPPQRTLDAHPEHAEIEEDPPPVIVGSIGDIALMDLWIANTEKMLLGANEIRYSALASTLTRLIKTRAELRPPPPPSTDDLEAAARPMAEAMRSRILAVVEKLEREAEAEGKCLHCGQPVRRT